METSGHLMQRSPFYIYFLRGDLFLVAFMADIQFFPSDP